MKNPVFSFALILVLAASVICATVVRQGTGANTAALQAIVDQFRADIEGQGMAPDDLTALDLMAMQFLEESERAGGDSFILRMLDGDGYQTMEIFGLGKA